MADDYTNTAEHRIPVPDITDDVNFTNDITNLRTRLNQGLRGTAAYNVDGTNYVLAAANAGALLSRGGGYPRGSVIGAASGQDPYVTLYTNTGAALVGEWSIGADDSDSDKLMFSTGTDLSAPKMTLTEAGYLGLGITTPQSILQIKQASNIDLLIGGAQVLGGAISLNAINDANAANIPLEIRSSETMFSSGNVAIGNIARTHPLNVDGAFLNTTIRNSASHVDGLRVSKSAIAVAGTAVVDVTQTHSRVTFDIYVTFSSDGSLTWQGEITATINSLTAGSTGALTIHHNGSVGNFVVVAGDFVVTRPSNGVVRLTYTNNNVAGDQVIQVSARVFTQTVNAIPTISIT